LFEEREQSPAWGRRAAVMAALLLLGTAVVLFTLTARNRAALESRASGTPPSVAAPSLELLSLRDSRDADTMTISGLVHNPRGGAPLNRVAVTAFLFDRGGAFLASGRALLDVTSLAPGDESPFVVTVQVPASDEVSRYRVGFRDDRGRVLGHIDKRQQGAVADAAPNAALGTLRD
jgi:hypothetical protein